jgi:hypothetical protein
MRSARPLVVAATLLLAALAAPAQDGNKPTARLSLSPDPEGAAAGTLEVRPNADRAYYVHAVNPGKDTWKNLRVVVSRDKAGKQVVATGTVAELKPGATELIQLAAPTPVPPAAPVVPPAPGAAPVPPAGPPGVPAPGVLFLSVFSEKGGDPLTTSDGANVGAMRPEEYVFAEASVITEAGVSRLIVRLSDRHYAKSGQKNPADFAGPPAKVRLDLRPELVPNLDPRSLKAGTFQAVLPPGGKDIVLEASDLRFTGATGKSLIPIAIDGYERGITFVTEFGGNSPSLLATDAGLTRIDLPRYAIPGKPLRARLEVFNDPAGSRPKFEFVRTPGDAGGPAEDITADAKTARDSTLTLEVKGGGLTLHSVVKDWSVPVDTAGVYGDRNFRLGLVNESGDLVGKKSDANDQLPKGVAVVSTARLTLDDTPPRGVAFLVLPKEHERGQTLRVYAAGEDDESQVAEVLIFLGDPPAADGKPAPGTRAEKGVAFTPDPKAKPELAKPDPDADPDAPKPRPKPPLPTAAGYRADFPLPDAKGRVKFGVRVTNGVGLVTQESAEVVLLDPIDPPTVGRLKVLVVQVNSEIPQPGLTVDLRDADDKLVKSGTTDALGEVTFKALKPGAYKAYSIKPADANAWGRAAGTVVAGKVGKAKVELAR